MAFLMMPFVRSMSILDICEEWSARRLQDQNGDGSSVFFFEESRTSRRACACQPALQCVHPPGSSRASSREPRSEIPGATRPLPGTSSSSLRASSPKPTAANSSLRHGSVRCSNGQVHHSRSVGRPRDRCLGPQKQRSSAELSGADGSSWTAVGWRKQTKSKRKIQISRCTIGIWAQLGACVFLGPCEVHWTRFGKGT